MTYLKRIIDQKRLEVNAAKETIGLKQLLYYKDFNHKARSLSAHILSDQHNGIIAEFKRQSPSKGIINATAAVKQTVSQYQKAGVSAVSVLTDQSFFGGTDRDLSQAFEVLTIPILRKEFMVDPWQIYEARAIGASAILLIAAVLSKKEALEMAALASYLGLEVLMELHGEEELPKVNAFVDVVGINNRNLKTFEVDLNHSIKLAAKLPNSLPKVSESGIHSLDEIQFLRQHGFNGFLIGENFMKQDNPGQACLDFCNELQTLKA